MDTRITVEGVQDDADGAPVAPERLHDLEATEIAHVRVEDEHIRARRVHQPQRVVAVTRDADHDHPELGVQQVAQVLADRGMVVGDDDPEGAGRCGRHGPSIPSNLIALNRLSRRLTRPIRLNRGSFQQ